MYDNRIIQTAIRLKKYKTIRFLLINGADIDLIGKHWEYLFDESPPFIFDKINKKWIAEEWKDNSTTDIKKIINEHTEEECVALYEVPQVDDWYLKCPHGHVLLYRVWMVLVTRKDQCQYCTVPLDTQTIYPQISIFTPETEYVPDEPAKVEPIENELAIKDIKEYFLTNKFPVREHIA